MNLRQMEVFRAVMVTGTVAGAAEALHVSQPTVSKALSLGERRTGLRLFDRVKGRLIATPEGKRLYEEVDRLWAGVEKVRALVCRAGRSDGRKAADRRLAEPGFGAHTRPPSAPCSGRCPTLKVKVDLLVPSSVARRRDRNNAVDVGLALFRIGPSRTWRRWRVTNAAGSASCPRAIRLSKKMARSRRPT